MKTEMKKYLHKLPLAGLAMLVLTGCGDTIKQLEAVVEANTAHRIQHSDTIMVLNVRHPTYGTPSHIWGVNRRGQMVDGHINLKQGVVFPHDGDEIVVHHDNPHSSTYIDVLDNLTQRQRAQKYINQHTR